MLRSRAICSKPVILEWRQDLVELPLVERLALRQWQPCRRLVPDVVVGSKVTGVQ
jgi:hypothetical protein